MNNSIAVGACAQGGGVADVIRWSAAETAREVNARRTSAREVTDAVLAHVTTNALLTAYVLATGNWSLWS